MTMDARKWLGRARMINREINTLLLSLDETRDQIQRITQNYESDGAQSTKDPHKFDSLVELENRIDQRIDELVRVKDEITAAIGKLPDGRHRTVLQDYYVRCMTLEQTAVEIGYSYAHVKRLRAIGISQIQKMSLNEP